MSPCSVHFVTLLLLLLVEASTASTMRSVVDLKAEGERGLVRGNVPALDFYDLAKGTSLTLFGARKRPSSNATSASRRPLLPCSCRGMTCGCCAGMRIVTLNYDRRACMNITYDPYEFAISTNMLMNDESVYMNRVSAKNPRPLCVPLPIPFIRLRFDMCVKLFDVYMPGRNLHMCLDFETRVQRRPISTLHFNCIRLGADGLALVRPEDGGGLVDSSGGDGEMEGDTETDIDIDIDTDTDAEGDGGDVVVEAEVDEFGPAPAGGVDEDYDAVTEDRNKTASRWPASAPMPWNTIKNDIASLHGYKKPSGLPVRKTARRRRRRRREVSSVGAVIC